MQRHRKANEPRLEGDTSSVSVPLSILDHTEGRRIWSAGLLAYDGDGGQRLSSDTAASCLRKPADRESPSLDPRCPGWPCGGSWSLRETSTGSAIEEGWFESNAACRSERTYYSKASVREPGR